MIYKASIEDIDAIKRIADHNKESIGFVMRPALVFSLERGWLLVTEHEGQIVGFCNYRHCRDKHTTIYEICVALSMRGQGIGREMIDALIAEARIQRQFYIQLKAVVGLPANEFYAKCGFEHVGVDEGKKRPLNIWRYLF